MINVQSFGAVGDGLTDDSAAFNLALASGNEILIPFTQNGYKINSPVLVNMPVKIKGEGLVKLIGTTKLFDIRSSNVTIDSISVHNADDAFYLNTAMVSMEFVKIINCNTHNCLHAISDSNSTNLVVNLHIRDVTCWYGRGVQVSLYDVFAFLFISNLTIDHARSIGLPINFVSIEIYNNNGGTLEKVNINSNNLGTGDGIKLNTCNAVHLREVMADTLGGKGIDISNCQFLYLSDVVASLCSLGGMAITSSHYIQATNIVTAGRRGLSNSPTAKGLSINGCSNIQFANISSRHNNGIGVEVSNCSNGKVEAIYNNNVSNLTKVNSSTIVT